MRPTRGLDGPTGMISARGDDAAGGLAGPEAERAENQEKRNFWIKIGFFEFTKALEICRRRFSWNFDMRIFPKFF
jgi:hypothetical protein